MPGLVLEGNMVYELVIMGEIGDDDKPLEIRPLSNTTDQLVGGTPTP